jgi:hypothetical protein
VQPKVRRRRNFGGEDDSASGDASGEEDGQGDDLDEDEEQEQRQETRANVAEVARGHSLRPIDVGAEDRDQHCPEQRSIGSVEHQRGMRQELANEFAGFLSDGSSRSTSSQAVHSTDRLPEQSQRNYEYVFYL